ncbi:M1 family aminopeptidase [Nonlabens ponticola]|uniref:Aminopeptidase N n=1 Tax=Nonlabens ponticola TaxID=2496866 RepID=A0A3S9MUW2_9FLAO|nr:M1 family aminopeptidase [Nonlabens ponticola]AZQ42969.1 T9SS type A sorting domain-containing protein [Nonlabens ponticola]
MKIDWCLWVFMVLAFAKADSLIAQQHTTVIDVSNDAVQACIAKSRLISSIPQKNAFVSQDNYDVLAVELELDIDPDMDAMSGEMTMDFKATENLNRIYLDFADGMTAETVTSDAGLTTITAIGNDLLQIDFENAIAADNQVTISIAYSGNPEGTGFGSYARRQHDGQGIIWTLSEPYGAKSWWPCKQDLNDKIDATTVTLNVPYGNTGVSNGLLIEELDNGAGKTYTWQHNYPIPAYLIAFAVTNYEKFTQEYESDLSAFNINNYVYPEDLERARSDLAVTPPMMSFFEESYGVYPFKDEKYGHAQFGWNGGMEHTTISFMGTFSFNLTAHELAHQWFGNKVTCGSWQDIWINESFATYANGKAIQKLKGEDSFKSWRESRLRSITSAPDGSVYVPAADTLSVSRVFNGRLSYNKGAMVLNMLEDRLGADVFNSVLKNFLNNNALAFDYAKTEDFLRVAEVTSGQDLREFFDDWIYDEGHPSYQVTYSQDQNLEVSLDIEQTTSHESVDLFEGQLPLRLVGENQTRDILVDINANQIQIVLDDIDFAVTDVMIDPETKIISSQNTATLSMDDFDTAQLRLYPNPARDYFIVDGMEGRMEQLIIYDLQGRIVDQYQDANASRFEVPATPGMYLVKIMLDDTTLLTRSLLVQ